MQIEGRVIYFKALDKDQALDRFIEVLEEVEMYFCGNVDLKDCAFVEMKKKERIIKKYSEMSVDGRISVMEPLAEKEILEKFQEILKTNELFFGGSHSFKKCDFIEK